MIRASPRAETQRLDTYQTARNIADRLKPLTDPAVGGFFNDREAALITKMVNADPADDDARRSAALEIKALRDFRSWLAGALTAGTIATKKLEEMAHGR